MNKWRTDLNDVIVPAADIEAYLRICQFLTSIENNEDVMSNEIFKSLDLLARLFKRVGGV